MPILLFSHISILMTFFSIASSVFEELKPKAVLLTHFDDTFPPFSTETDTSEIEEQLKRYAAVYKLRNGGSVEI